jgi:hypothetical protein
MSGIFSSYRREDTAPYAGWLFHTLRNHFGEDQLFRDIDNIAPGDRFPAIIERAVATCDVMLALIGEKWLAVADSENQPRLQNPDDYVRRELVAGLKREGLLVIPVLVDGTAMPAPGDLPAPLRPLADRNALKLESADWDDDVARLIKTIARRIPAPAQDQANVAPPPTFAGPPTPTPAAPSAPGWSRLVRSRAAKVSLAGVLVVAGVAAALSFAGAGSSPPEPTPAATTTMATTRPPDTTIAATSTTAATEPQTPATRPPQQPPPPERHATTVPTVATTTTSTTATTTTLPYGPDTCKSGFVWREASPTDHVCVTPDVRQQVMADNAQASSRWIPGPYGPHTCISGYVWREAFPGDDVCVLPGQRDQAAYDNSQASTRLARNG